MTTPPDPGRPRGLRLHDLVGLVIGYGMAALLTRSLWPKSRPIQGFPGLALAFEFCWLGLAMSGPIVLLLDRRGAAGPRVRPGRPGRLISSKPPTVARPPVGRAVEGPPEVEAPLPFTRAELAWLVIGGYWIGLTLFVVPALAIDTPWALVGLLQLVTALGLWLVVPSKPQTGGPGDAWTHPAALVLLITWPVAWAVLILLSRTV